MTKMLQEESEKYSVTISDDWKGQSQYIASQVEKREAKKNRNTPQSIQSLEEDVEKVEGLHTEMSQISHSSEISIPGQ